MAPREISKLLFTSVYPLYVQKAERKGRTRAEVDEVVAWLTGYGPKELRRAIDSRVDFETFFAQAPMASACSVARAAAPSITRPSMCARS